MKPFAERNGLVVCFGKTMDELCATSIAEIARRHPQCRLQFVMSDWISVDQMADALAFWVVDPSTEVAQIKLALQYGVPLLVPETSGGLKQACIDGNCGLFYQTKTEAMACLVYLAGNPVVRDFLAKNAAASSDQRVMAAAR